MKKRSAFSTAQLHVHGWSPGFFIDKAKLIGDSTLKAIEILLKRTEQVEQKYRAARGILSLANTYTTARLEHACKRALFFNNVYCSTIKTILKHGLDKTPLVVKKESTTQSIVIHENIRGITQYQ